MSDYNEYDSQDRENRENTTGSEETQTNSSDGTYRYSYRSAGENPEGQNGSSSEGADSGRGENRDTSPNWDSSRYESGDSDSGGRYTYSDSSRNPQDDGRQYQQSYYGSSPTPDPKRRGNGPRIAIAVVGALVLGGVIGAACWSIGGRIGGSSAQTADAVAQIETAASAETQNSGEVTEETSAEEETSAGEETTAGEEAEETAEAAASDSADSAVTTAGSSDGTAIAALDVSGVVESTMPAIVAITTTTLYEYYNSNGYIPFFWYGYGDDYGDYGGSSTYEVEGAGSGIIIGDDGEELWIVTNNHVVEDSDTLTVTFCEESTVDAYVKGTDANNDLAVVGVKLSDLSDSTRSAIRAISMGDSDSLRLGETVIAIGNALGLGQSVSTGVVSALNREITVDDLTLTTIQTDAAINPGNSGGALLNSRGELIGINVAKDTESGVEGMGFAIPISSARGIIENLTTMAPREAVSEDLFPYMGVSLTSVDSSMQDYYGMPQGVLVYGVSEGTPAEEAGLLEYDIITAFEGVTVTTYDELYEELQYYEAGTTVTLTVKRLENGAYNDKEIQLKLGKKSDYDTSEEATESSDSGAGQSGSDNTWNFRR